MSATSHTEALHQKITRRFKIYGGFLWGVFLIAAILIPSLNGLDDDSVKRLAGKSFVILLIAYYIPYFVTWKFFERKYGRIKKDERND